MVGILQYLDYRVFLRDYYKAQKLSNSFFSYRYMAKKLNLHASYLVRILQESVHLASSRIPLVITMCDFNVKEAEYFEGKEELLAKVRYYLKHESERERIAAAGRERCLKSGYSNQDRIKGMLQVITNLREDKNRSY